MNTMEHTPKYRELDEEPIEAFDSESVDKMANRDAKSAPNSTEGCRYSGCPAPLFSSLINPPRRLFFLDSGVGESITASDAVARFLSNNVEHESQLVLLRHCGQSKNL